MNSEKSRLGLDSSHKATLWDAYAIPGSTRVLSSALVFLPLLLQALAGTTDPLCSSSLGHLRAPTRVVPNLRLNHGTLELSSAPRADLSMCVCGMQVYSMFGEEYNVANREHEASAVTEVPHRGPRGGTQKKEECVDVCPEAEMESLCSSPSVPLPVCAPSNGSSQASLTLPCFSVSPISLWVSGRQRHVSLLFIFSVSSTCYIHSRQLEIRMWLGSGGSHL